MVDNSGAAGAAFATEIGSTVPAEQFGCQQIIVLSLVTSRGFLVFLHFGLYPVKKVFRYDSRYAIRNENIPVLIFAVVKFIIFVLFYALHPHTAPNIHIFYLAEVADFTRRIVKHNGLL